MLTCWDKGFSAKSITLATMRSMGSSTSARLSRLRNQWKDARTAMMKRERAMLRMACTHEPMDESKDSDHEEGAHNIQGGQH